MSDLQKFVSQEFGEVKGLEYQNQPWLIGKDVAKCLGYKNTRVAIQDDVEDEDKVVTKVTTLGGKQNTVIINESGFYSLVFGSKLPTAKKFKHWVTSEVLPQIRQTGGYIPVKPDDDEKAIMARGYVVAMKTIEQKDEIIKNLIPKAKQFDTLMNANGNYSVNQISNILDFGEYNFFKMLRQNKVLHYSNGDNVPYRRFRDAGYFIVAATIDPAGHDHSTTYITPKGLSYLCKRFKLSILEGTVA